jgi:hypothetical protein
MTKALIKTDIQNKVFNIRGVNVMLDRDLAALYGVEARALNQAVKRNSERFPPEFMFRLTKEELITNCDKLGISKYSPSLPYAFTEHGVAMLSSVLRSKSAIAINIQIINTFVSLRKYALKTAGENALTNRLSILEKALLLYIKNNDKRIDEIILALNALIEKPQKEIGRIGFAIDK